MGLSHEGRESRLISARLPNSASKDMLLNLCGEILIVRATSFYLDLLDIVVRRPSSVWTPLDIVVQVPVPF